ncbi:MAG: NapC/NirT family cytochrome c, partial [Anaerolineae bacterium]|nr:NapC/NirT family cytochrome c [Anaerolineae bacterium]
MVGVREFLSRLRQRVTLRSLLPYALVAVGIIAILLAVPPAWEYSNSPSFCGLTCHTMPPEYSSYLISPHSRILCVDCHIGRDLLLVQFFRKAGHM